MNKLESLNQENSTKIRTLKLLITIKSGGYQNVKYRARKRVQELDKAKLSDGLKLLVWSLDDSEIDTKLLEAKLIISYSVTKSGLLSASVESSRTEIDLLNYCKEVL